MMVDAEDLKARVRAFLVAEKWPINRFAKAVNLTHPTIQNIFDEKWNPRADTLQACLETIKKHRPVTRKEYDKPVHYKIPTNLLDRSENLFFKHCVALWNGQDKFLDTEFLRRLDEIGARGRWSDIYVGPDNRLRIAHYGPDAFGARFHATDTLLMDMPQRDLFDWVEARVWEILGSGTPEFSSCVAPTQSIIGTYDVPYTALVLPCVSTIGGPIDSVISITRLEPSEYRDKISLIKGTAHAA